MPLERNGGDPAEDFWRGGILHTVRNGKTIALFPGYTPRVIFD